MHASKELIQERWVGGVRCHAITLMLCHHLDQEKNVLFVATLKNKTEKVQFQVIL